MTSFHDGDSIKYYGHSVTDASRSKDTSAISEIIERNIINKDYGSNLMGIGGDGALIMQNKLTSFKKIMTHRYPDL